MWTSYPQQEWASECLVQLPSKNFSLKHFLGNDARKLRSQLQEHIQAEAKLNLLSINRGYENSRAKEINGSQSSLDQLLPVDASQVKQAESCRTSVTRRQGRRTTQRVPEARKTSSCQKLLRNEKSGPPIPTFRFEMVTSKAHWNCLRVQCPPQTRKVSVSRPALSDIPESCPPKSALFTPVADLDSRRSSKDATSRRSSLGITFNATVKILRSGHASPTPKRASPSRGPPPEPAGNADALDKVPLPSNPRFTSTMSVEAQYTILRCYEDRLRRLLTNSYPDYSSLLHRTDSPDNSKVSLKRQSVSDDEDIDDDDGDDDDSSGDEFQLRSTRSLPPSLYARTASTGRPQMTQSARPNRRPNVRVPHYRQLTLSRRLQMAHKLLDTVHERPTAATTKEKLNPIQGYNLWANGWREEFDVQEEKGDALL